MAAQDAILRLLLQNQQLIGELGNTVRQWVEATRRMDQAADQVTFDATKKEVDVLRQKIEALAATSVKDLARIDTANKQMAKELGVSSSAVKKVETAITQFAAKAEKELDKVAAQAKKIELAKFRQELKDSERASAEFAKKWDAEVKKTEQSLARWSKTADQEAKKTQAVLDRIQLRKLREEYAQAQRVTGELAASAARHFKSMEAVAVAAGARIGVGIGGQITALGPNLQRLRSQFDTTIAAMRSASDRVTFERLRTQAQTLQAQIQRLGVQAQNDLQNIRKGADSASSGMSTMSQVARRLQGVLASIGIVLSLRQLVQFGEDAVQVGIRVQALNAQLEAAGGTQERFTELQKFAHESSERLGFDFEVLAQSTARFEAATRLAGISESERLNVIRSTIEAARVLQLSNQRLNNTLLALEQIASKGTVSMEELRRQLGDNVPGAVQILAKELNVTVAELFKMIEANKVLSSEALPALARGFDKAFGAGLPVALQTTATAVGQLKKEILDLKVAFAESFGEELRQALLTAKEGIEGLHDPARIAGKIVGEQVAGSIPIIIGLGNAVSAASERFEESAGSGGPINIFAAAIDSIVAGVLNLDAGLTAGAFRVLGFSDAADAAARKAQATGTSYRGLLRETLALRDASGELEDKIRSNSAQQEVLALKAERLRSELKKLEEQKRSQGGTSLELARREEELSDELEDVQRRTRELGDEEEKLTGKRKSGNRTLEELIALVAALREERKRETEGIRARVSAEEELNNALTEGFAAQRKAREEVFGNVAELHKQADELLDAVSSLRGGLAGLNVSDEIDEIVTILKKVGPATDEQIARLKEFGNVTVEQVALLRDKIQETLDDLLAAGEAPSEAFQLLAEQFGVTTTIVEKELEEQSKAAEKAAKEEEQAAKRRIQALERIGDAFLKLSEQLGKGQAADGLDDLKNRLSELENEAEQLEFGEAFADPERLQEVQVEIELVREQIRNFKEDQTALGEETTKTANIINEAIRGLIDQMVPLLGKLNDTQESNIQSILRNLQAIGAEGKATSKDVADALSRMIVEFQSAGVPVEDLQSALFELETGTLSIEKAFAAARREFEEGGEGLESAADSAERMKEEAKKTADEVENLKNKVAASVNQINSELETVHPKLEVIKTDFREIVQLCEAWKACMLGAGG